MNGRRILLAAVFLALTVSVSAVVVSGSDDSDADVPNLTRLSAEVFSDTSTSYANLAYLSDELPKELSPVAWRYNASDMLWYNVDENSPDYGNILTYGAIGLTDVDIIRSDILNAYSAVFAGPEFQILQVKYNVVKECTLSITVTKTGMPDFVQIFDEAHGIDDCYFTSDCQSVKLFSVDSTNGDIAPAEIRGVYHVSVVSDGASCLNRDLEILGAPLKLKGLATDADGVPVAGASVTYYDGITAHTIQADDAGVYTISAFYRSSVRVDSITANGYTFSSGLPYSYGTVLADVSPGPVFHAREHTVNVSVVDQTGGPVIGIGVVAMWYHQTGTGPTYSVSVDEPVFTGVTGVDGTVSVAFSDSPVDVGISRLYVRLDDSVSHSGYTYSIFNIPTGSSVPAMPVSLSGGNAYVDTEHRTCAPLEVKESALTVTVTDGSAVNPLPYIPLKTVWVLEKFDGADFLIRTTTTGTCWALPTGTDGVSSVFYSAPSELVDPEYKAYLLVYAQAPGGVIPSSLFTFNVVPFPFPPISSVSVTSLVLGYEGCTLIPFDSPADSSVKSVEDSCTISYSLFGDIPDYVTVQLAVSGTSQEFRVDSVAGALSFVSVVKKGVTGTIRVTSPGYTFTDPVLDLGTVTENQVRNVGSTRITIDVNRGHPVAVGSPVDVTGLHIDDQVTITFRSGGAQYKTTVKVDSANLSYQVLGWPGAMVSEVSVTGGSSMYVQQNASGEFVVNHLVTRKFVTFSSDSTVPEVTTVVSNISISFYIGDSLFGTARTDSTGLLAANVPDVPELRYMNGEYNLDPVNITSGAFKNCIAFNLKGIVDTAQTISFKIRYTASNGVDGSVIDIVNPDSEHPASVTVKVGQTCNYTAPSLKGFVFGGWFIDGVRMTEAGNDFGCQFLATASMDGQTLIAAYSVYEEPVPEDKFDPVAVAIGLVAVVIALLVFSYVLLNVRRY